MPQSSPYGQPPQQFQAQRFPMQQPQPKAGLSGWKLGLALFGAWLVGVLSMIAFAFMVPVEDDPLTPEEREKLEQIDELFNYDEQ